MQGKLKGYKTYIAAGMGALGAILSYFTGDISLVDASQLVLTAVLGVTIRQGIKTDAGK